MTVAERIRQLVAALPSDASAVTLTRADLTALVDSDGEGTPRHSRDLTVEEVAEETRRAPSTVRGWLIAGELRGYKLNGRDWRVTPEALRQYLADQAGEGTKDAPAPSGPVDIGAWRKGR